MSRRVVARLLLELWRPRSGTCWRARVTARGEWEGGGAWLDTRLQAKAKENPKPHKAQT